MAIDWHTLPLEIWLNIFQHVESPSDLIQCRMACKSWNPLAEKFIFKEDILIKDTRSLIGFYHHLLKKPRLGRSTKALHIKPAYSSKRIDTKKLLLVIMNEDFECLEWSSSLEDTWYSDLLKIVNIAPEKVRKLKTIADPPVYYVNATYPKLIYALRDSIEHMQINLDLRNRLLMEDVYGRLNEFKSLKSISFRSCPFESLTTLDRRLQELQHLYKLKLGLQRVSRDGYVEKNAAEMKEWLQENVQQNEILKDLHLNPEFRSEGITTNLIEYVTYKYPSLARLTLSNVIFLTSMERVISTIKNFPFIDLRSCAFENPNLGDYLELTRMMKGDVDNVIDLGFQTASSEPTCTMKKNATTGSSQIRIRLERTWSHETFRHVLSTIGDTAAGVSRLTLDLFSHKHWAITHDSQSLMSFMEVLVRVPQVKYFFFGDALIEYQHLEPGELILPNLQTLLLWGAKIDSRVLSTISRISPKLSTLRLISCLVQSNGNFEQKTLIHMPSTSFTALFLLTANISLMAPAPVDELGDLDEFNESDDIARAYEHFLSIHALIKVANVAFLRISCSEFQNREQCYMLFSKAPPMLISKEELQLYSVKHQTFDIECKSIASLNIEIEDFVVQMTFNTNGELEGGLKSPVKLLEEQNAALIEKHDILKKQETKLEEKLAASGRESTQLTERFIESEKRYIEAEKRYIESEKKSLELQKEIMMTKAQYSHDH